MSSESRSIPEYLPHLVILITLLVYEYSMFFDYLALALDTASSELGLIYFVFTQIALVILVIIVIGLISIASSSSRYRLMVKVALCLFLGQLITIMALMFPTTA